MDRAVLVGTAIGLRVWLYDRQPSQNIQPSRANDISSVFIRMLGVPTFLTNEKTLRSAVCPFGVVTLTALLAGVPWVNEDTAHTAPPRFVARDEVSELRECPAVQPVTLNFFSPCPFANPFEIFKRNSAIGAFSQRYDGFGNDVRGLIDHHPSVYDIDEPTRYRNFLTPLHLPD
jgi:hypothetical protein